MEGNHNNNRKKNKNKNSQAQGLIPVILTNWRITVLGQTRQKVCETLFSVKKKLGMVAHTSYL
jgi:hypothetical protein